jgi:hypothetical protein
MTRSEAETACLVVMEEYLPKSLSKKERKEMLHSMFYELSEGGALALEDDQDPDEEPIETEDISVLLGRRA